MLKCLVTLALLCPPSHAASSWEVKPAAPEPYSLLSGYAATLTALGFRKVLVDDLQKSESGRKPLGHYSQIGDLAGQVIPNALYVGGELLAARWGNASGNRRAQIMILGTAEAAVLSTAIKLVVREERPNHSAHNSFPSGHSTTIFAFAAVVQAEHGWAYGLPAFALAAFTGYSRINDNMHYLHDVLAGATIGLSFGLGVALANRGPTATALHVTPMPLDRGAGLCVSARF